MINLEDFYRWIKEDSPFGDYTTEILFKNDSRDISALIISKSEGLIACIEDICEVLEKFGIKCEVYIHSGKTISKGSVIARLRGSLHKILLVERTILNLLMYLSGVATTTRRLVELVRSVNPNVRVAATRKILPGLRYLVKKAVKIGGGDTHRFSLSDAVLIKDNHIKLIGSVRKAVEIAKRGVSFIHKVEVEVSNAHDALEAAKAGADIIMLDNVTPEEVEKTVKLLEVEGFRDKVIIEVSGGINPDNIVEYAKAGPDIISTSYITMRPEIVDMSLEVE